MDNQKMAALIARLRKEKQLTQKELADQLGITDKAVSKWERGLSCPDIALLAPLAEILGVSTSELLNGEAAVEEQPELETVVEKTIEYADHSAKRQIKNLNRIFGTVYTVLSLISIFVCVICDFAMNRRLSWSLIPGVCVLFAWLLVIPLFHWNKKGIFAALVNLTIAIIPFLFLLERTIGMAGMILPLGTKVSIISVVYLWLLYLIISKAGIKRSAKASAGVFLTVIAFAVIDMTVNLATNQPIINIWDILIYGCLSIAAVIIYLAGRAR